MSNIEQEVFFEQESIRLPLPLVLKIAKNLNGEEHRLSLAISGAMDGQSHGLFIIGKCHFLTPGLWGGYFTQYIYPEGITNFSASTCYWLPAKLLFENIAKMPNLQELGIDDTKLSLIHLLRIFKVCEKVLKLSFTLREASLDSYQENTLGKALFETLCRGFSRLTHLKLFTTNLGRKTYDSWPVTLNVLSWCHDCVDLLIEVDHLSLSVWNESTRFWTKLESADSANQEKVLQLVRDKFLPHLGWFKSLKSLVVVMRRNDYWADEQPFTAELIDWLFIKRELFPSSIERLWITDELQISPYLLANSKLPTSQMKSLFLWDLQHDDSFTLDDQRLNEIEHLAGLSFPNELKVKKTKLKFAQGHFIDHYGLKKFCDEHPQLEYLYIDTEIEDGGIDRSISLEPRNGMDHKIGDADWKLLKLKVLAYKSSILDEETLDQLITNCLNIEELHLYSDMRDSEDLPRNYNASFFSKIRFPNLKKLSLELICLCDGDDLIPIMENCPKLHSLNIDCSGTSLCTPSIFLGNLGKSLSLAKNLCDLRLALKEETQANVFRLLNDVLSSCPLLERFVFNCSIKTIERGEPTNWENPDELEEYLLKFVTKLKKLTVLSLDGIVICSEITTAIGDRLANEILPLRPSFWFFLGVNLYNKANIPRVLRDEIIFPCNCFNATPKF